MAPPAGFAADAQGGRQYVTRALTQGTDLFKVNLNVPREAFDVIVDAANERDLTVHGHISGQIGVEHFIRYLTDLEGLRERPETRYLTQEERQQIADPETNFVVQLFGSGPEGARTAERYLGMQDRIIRASHDARVPLLAGTDASAAPGSVRGFDLHLELEQLVEHGLTPVEALAAATRRPGEFWDDRGMPWGTLTARADLVVLGANPLEDITATRDSDGVMAAGTWYPQATLQEMLDDIAAEYGAQGRSQG